MKCLIFSLLLLAGTLSAQQITNASFENWHTVPGTRGAEDPDGWESNNFILDTTTGYGVFRSTTAHSGNYSARIEPAQKKYQRVGILSLGELMFQNGFVDSRCGDSLGYVPFIVTGYYQYHANDINEEKVECNISLTESRCNSGLTMPPLIGGQTFSTTHYYSKFRPFAIPFEVNMDSLYPTSFISISFQYSDPDSSAAGGYFLVDDIGLEGEILSSENFSPARETKLELFPNPGSDKIFISGLKDIRSVEILNLQGKGILSFQTGSTALDVSSLGAGCYFVVVQTASGRYSQKFIKE